MTKRELLAIARRHGTPVVVVDHDVIRSNYASFRRRLPKVQAYYAVKANPAPEIVQTLYKAGASFDVASLPEFMLVHENIARLPAKERQDFLEKQQAEEQQTLQAVATWQESVQLTPANNDGP